MSANRIAEGNALAASATAVVKIGSSLLVDPRDGRLRESWLEGLAADVLELRDRGQRVVVVSSGAIALGRSLLGFQGRT